MALYLHFWSFVNIQDDSGYQNPSSYMTRVPLFQIVNTLIVNALVMQGAGASVAMVLTWCFQNILVSATEWSIPSSLFPDYSSYLFYERLHILWIPTSSYQWSSLNGTSLKSSCSDFLWLIWPNIRWCGEQNTEHTITAGEVCIITWNRKTEWLAIWFNLHLFLSLEIKTL